MKYSAAQGRGLHLGDARPKVPEKLEFALGEKQFLLGWKLGCDGAVEHGEHGEHAVKHGGHV